MTLKITYLNGKVQTIERVMEVKHLKGASCYSNMDEVVVSYGHECFQKIEKKHVTKMEVEF